MDALTVALYSMIGMICILGGIAVAVFFGTLLERRNADSDLESNAKQDDDLHWCLVGNIVGKRPHSRGERAPRGGTKHFRPGTEVYCLPIGWLAGYDQIKAIGRHRASNQFMTIVIPAKCVTSWRAKIVCEPEVLRRLCVGASEGLFTWKSKQEVEAYVAKLSTHDS